MSRKTRPLSARIARFVIFNSTKYFPGAIGIALRRNLRAKYMPKVKTAPKHAVMHGCGQAQLDSLR